MKIIHAAPKLTMKQARWCRHLWQP